MTLYRDLCLSVLAVGLAGCAAFQQSALPPAGAPGPAATAASAGQAAAPDTSPLVDTSRPNPAVPSAGALTAEFLPGGEDEVIVVRALNRQAIRSAALIESEGRVTSAFTIDQVQDPRASGASGMPFAPDTPSISPAPGIYAPTPAGILNETDTLIGQTLSAASIRVPDRDLYAKSWRDNRLRVEFGLGIDQRVIIMAAPPPQPRS